jgi:hypothetical protein
MWRSTSRDYLREALPLEASMSFHKFLVLAIAVLVIIPAGCSRSVDSTYLVTDDGSPLITVDGSHLVVR